MIDAMKQALESFEDYQSRMSVEKFDGAITALRQAIEQAEKQKPVAYRKEAHGMWFYIENKPSPPNDDYEPLYTAPPKREIEQEPESWMGVSDNPYCDDVDCNDPNSRAMRWHNKLLELRKQAALDGLAETSREIEQAPHPCDNGCQFAKDVGMPEQTCGGDCQYNKAMSTKPENIDTKTGCVDGVNSEPVAWVAYGFGGEKHNLDYEQEDVDALEVGTPLYLAPVKREWVGLTDEDIDNLELPDTPTVKQFVRFIEAKLREKNN